MLCTLVVLQFHAGYISLHPSVPRVYPRAGAARSNIITAPGNSMVMMMMMMVTMETMMVTMVVRLLFAYNITFRWVSHLTYMSGAVLVLSLLLD